MRKGDLSREQAVALVGEKSVDAVERENCDFTNRAQCDGDTGVEFSASVRAVTVDGDEVTLTAYYYIDQADLDANDDNSLDVFDWVVSGYEIY